MRNWCGPLPPCLYISLLIIYRFGPEKKRRRYQDVKYGGHCIVNSTSVSFSRVNLYSCYYPARAGFLFLAYGRSRVRNTQSRLFGVSRTISIERGVLENWVCNPPSVHGCRRRLGLGRFVFSDRSLPLRQWTAFLCFSETSLKRYCRIAGGRFLEETRQLEPVMFI